jgi:hypothetical protein
LECIVKIRSQSPLGRLLLGLLTLGVAVAPLAAAPTVRADDPKITLEAKWLLLRKEDGSDQMVQEPDKASEDGRALLTERRFVPNWKGSEDHPPVPTLTLDRLWLAKDIATARDIFREQADAGFAEARVNVESVGGVELPPLGDESRGIGGCTFECAVVHTRVVFRYLNAVHVLYVFGPREYAYREVVVNWAKLLDERVRAVPSGPAADVVHQVSPRQVALTAGEVGNDAFQVGEQEGSDAGTPWYWVRVQRDIEASIRHRGPADVYTKVWVAKDVETARGIFADQAKPGLPEAKQPFGADFPMDYTPNIGNENFGWSGCNDDCNTEKYNRLHHRLTFRIGNVVAVLYIWGENQTTSINQAQFYANSMKKRIP